MKRILLSLIAILCFFPVVADSNQSNLTSLRTKFEEAAREFDRGDFDKAITLFKETLEIHPNFVHSHNYLGMSYRAKGVPLNQVIKYFEKAAEIDPNFAPAYENLGKTYYSLGEFEKAEEACKKALEINPNMVSVQISLGWVYLIGMGQSSEAIEYFEKAIETKGNHPPYAYLGLGIAYYLEGDSPKVLELITVLRSIKYERLAVELEQMVRNGKQIDPNEFGAPLVAKGRKQSTLVRQFPKDLEEKKNDFDEGFGGMKVRLRKAPLSYKKKTIREMSGSERLKMLRNKENSASAIFGEYYGMTGHSY